MKNYEINMEWRCHDSRNANSLYYTGKSTLTVRTNSKEEAINEAISFCSELPSWELRKNNIDINQYKDEKTCSYHFITMIKRIVSIKLI